MEGHWFKVPGELPGYSQNQLLAAWVSILVFSPVKFQMATHQSDIRGPKWESPSLAQLTPELLKVIINCFFKLLSFGVVYCIALDNWKRNLCN